MKKPLVAVLAAVLVVVLGIGIFVSMQNNKSTAPDEIRGNTVGNIVNGGLVAQSGDWIYYSNTSDGDKLYKMRTDGTERTKLSDDWGSYINVVDNWIYYRNLSNDEKLYKMRTDGTERTKLSDDWGSYINVVDNWIYYRNLSDDDKLYKIRTDGTDRTKINDDSRIGYINVSDDWIYYSN